MKKFRHLKLNLIVAALFACTSAFAQVDPSVKVIELGDDGEGNIGVLETVINGDIDSETKMRLNPKRVYKLTPGAFYTQVSQINFGNASDTTATLIIEGEAGAIKPMILKMPLDGGRFTNEVHGSLVLRNVYMGAKHASDTKGGPLFGLFSTDQSLTLEGVVTENAVQGDLFTLRDVQGLVSIYIKDCYFRDNSQLGNSWNFSVIARGDNGEAIDTMWIENTTVTNAGMPFFGKNNPVNFAFINHNTIINTTKYPFWMEIYREAYFTNNMFINCNYEGECPATWGTQLVGDRIKSGILNVDTVETDMWFLEEAPKQEDVIYYAANNLSFYSPYLTKYYEGGYNDVADHPISSRTWGVVDAADIPSKVEAPLDMFNDRALGLAEAWENIKFEDNYDKTVDPELKTKSIRSQAAGDQFAMFMRNNYGVAGDGESYDNLDRSLMFFGDGEATTIPGLIDGQPSEVSLGLVSVTDIPDDFSYSANIVSKIDGKHLGALHWFPSEMAEYESDKALEQVIAKFNGASTGINNLSHKANQFKVYPNPANDIINVEGASELRSVSLYNVSGMMVSKQNMINSKHATFNIADLKKGIYILEIETLNGNGQVYKIRKN